MAKRQYTKKSDYWNSKTSVQKAAPAPQKEESNLVLSQEIGTLGLSSIRSFTAFLHNHETKFPESIRTYREMGEDPDVATALDAVYTFVDRAFFDFRIECNTKSAKSKKAAKFIDFSLRNMEAPLRQYVRSLLTYKQYGFAIAEKVFEIDEDPKSPYFGMYRLQKLGFRPQDTIDLTTPFTYSDDGREIISVNQNITGSMLSKALPQSLIGKKSIPIQKCVLVGNNITDNNPLGVSPLASVYRSWREKTLIQEYEVVGVSKDLGGMPVLMVPGTILNRASLNPNGEEAQSLRVLQSNIANLHAGEQSYMVLPSDIYENTSMRQYDLVFQGVQGSGKQFDTQALIKQRQLDIFNRFGAGVLIMGGGEGGSLSLSDNKQTLLSHYVERDVDTIIEAIQTQVIPTMLRINGMYLSQEDMPKFCSDDIGDPDIDTVSSAIQKIVGVKGLPMTPGTINEFFAMMGMKERIPDDVAADPEKFKEYVETYMSDPSSRSGDGIAAGAGNGTSTTAATRDNSVANVAN